MSVWQEAQKVEVDWWGDCSNTYGEETKQITYAQRMGLISATHLGEGRFPVYPLAGASVLDIGGGPVSLLLKTWDAGDLCVLDPARYPDWVYQRYRARKIRTMRAPAEEYECGRGFWNEAWIYNVLQHVQDPEKVVAVAKHSARLIRLFEWVDIPAYPGHPHELKARDLDRWLGRGGIVQAVDEALFGKADAYSGIFIT